MYKLHSLAVCFLLLCFTAQASAYTLILPQGDAEPVLMIDGNQDGGSVYVDVLMVDTSDLWNFGFVDTDDLFQSIINSTDNIGFYQFEGGDIVDFAIEKPDGSLRRTLSQGNATMVFTGNVAAEMSRNPPVDFDYWQGLTISWGGVNSYNDDFVTSLAGRNDGFAPLYLIPEPSGVFLSLSGGGFCFLVATHLLRRRRTKAVVVEA